MKEIIIFILSVLLVWYFLKSCYYKRKYRQELKLHARTKEHEESLRQTNWSLFGKCQELEHGIRSDKILDADIIG
jgi:hypothetical protein